MAEVIVRENEPLERALRRFKKKVRREGILRDVRRHRQYLKPSEVRRRERLRTLRRLRREQEGE
ncbi:MAG: 30S ribosomal protein S21 [Gemmatimonadetes bacterium]|nr:30S ribosomal protein S21 [Gemmatimonadota bacterium]